MFEYYNNTLCMESNALYNGSLYAEVLLLKKELKSCTESTMQNAMKQDVKKLRNVYLSHDDTIISKSNYDNLILRGLLKLVRKGGNGRTALVDFNSIPERFRLKIIERYGDPNKTKKQSRLLAGLKYDEKARDYFAEYPLKNGENLSKKKQKEYTANASIFNRIHEMVTETKGFGGKVKNVWINLPSQIEELPKDKWPHSLSHASEVLKRKYSAYMLDEPTKRFKRVGYESLIHAGFCNSNTQKIKGDVADWWLSMYSLPNKLKVPIIMVKYNLIKDNSGFPSLTNEAVNKWLHKPEVERIWYLGRHGEEAWRNKFGYFVKRNRDNWFPNAYWAIDGSKIDWMHYEDNTTGFAAKLKIDPVIDVFSEKIIGWSISETENHIDHFKAVKMAAISTGSRPYMFTYDNQSGHKSARMQELYSGLVARQNGVHYANQARRHNSPAENVFKRLQQQVINIFWWSDKQSPTVRTLDNKPNQDFINEFKHKLKTKEQLIKAWEVCVKLWNDAKHPKYKDMTRNEVFEMDAPMSEPITLLDQIDLFWIFNEGSRYKRGGIKLTVANRDYEFEVYDSDNRIDLEFRRKNVGKKLLIKYDPDHLKEFVALYDVDDSGNRVWLANAQPKRQHESVPVLMKEGDKAAWKADFNVTEIELERDRIQLQKLRKKTGITPEQLIEDQELLIKFSAALPKTQRNNLETSIDKVSRASRL